LQSLQEPAVAKAVAQIIYSQKLKLAQRTSKRESDAVKMVGKTKFRIPSVETLGKHLLDQTSAKKTRILQNLSVEKKDFEGMITLREYQRKVQNKSFNQMDEVKEYVKKFTTAQRVTSTAASDAKKTLFAFKSTLR